MNFFKQGWPLAGALTASVLSASCCLGPLVMALAGIGVGGYGLALEPFRPWFLVMTFLFLGGGLYLAYRPAPDCRPDEACTRRRTRRYGQILLWIVTAVAIGFAAFPYYSQIFF